VYRSGAGAALAGAAATSDASMANEKRIVMRRKRFTGAVSLEPSRCAIASLSRQAQQRGRPVRIRTRA
jgi:hypothetical protein